MIIVKPPLGKARIFIEDLPHNCVFEMHEEFFLKVLLDVNGPIREPRILNLKTGVVFNMNGELADRFFKRAVLDLQVAQDI